MHDSYENYGIEIVQLLHSSILCSDFNARIQGHSTHIADLKMAVVVLHARECALVTEYAKNILLSDRHNIFQCVKTS